MRLGIGLGILAAMTAGSLEGQACATCFGASDAPMAQGMNMGILALLGVVGFVLSGVAAFFGYLGWRASRVAALELDDELPAEGESTQANWR